MKALKDRHTLLQELQRLLQPQLEMQYTSCTWQLVAKHLVISIDEQQMEQVINNLKNAMGAIGEEGDICIRTQPHPLYLFTPFYTTKNSGQGIGLTMVHDILVNHGFVFSLSSSFGLTSFTIYL